MPFQYRISGSKAIGDALFDITSLGLTAAATITGGSQAKTVLAGLATAVTGSKLAVSQNMFAEKATYVLIAQMDAARQEVGTRVRGSMTQPIDKYPLAIAISDLYEYYQAGTLPAALNAVASDAAQTSNVAQETATITYILQNWDNPQAQAMRRGLSPEGLKSLEEGRKAILEATNTPASANPTTKPTPATNPAPLTSPDPTTNPDPT